MKKLLSVFTLLFVLTSVLTAQVASNGQLNVGGNKIFNASGNPVSFAGNSFFWCNDNWGGEKYYNASVVNWLQSDWKSTIVRAAMGVEDAGGYLDNPTGNKTKIKAVIDAAIAADMYVIIDWHSHHAENHTNEAKAFFSEMAQTYGAFDNVIFEIYNEPLAVSWTTVKNYAEQVIPVIRQYSDNLIVVGTPNWSQDVDQAAQWPITSSSNIAYTIHFYADSHKQSLRDKCTTALNQGIALFCTEWGTTGASGDGYVNEPETWTWIDFMKNNGISHCNWSINDKNESASVLNPGASSTGGWSNLTQSGNLVRDIIRSYTSSTGGGSPTLGICDAQSISTAIEAENFCTMDGIQTETCTEGGSNVGFIDAGDWLSYNINVPSAGEYTVEYRVASLNGGGVISLEQNEGTTVLGTVNVAATGGWQNWTTISHTVTLAAGEQAIGLGFPAGGFNINWFNIKATTTGGGVGFQGATFTIEAENYSFMSGVQKENCLEGGQNVGYLDAGDWMAYHNVAIPATGTYKVEYRVASLNGGGSLKLESNGGATLHGSLSIPSTNGWQNWSTVSHTVTLDAGNYNFGTSISAGGFNLNWIKFTQISDKKAQLIEDELTVRTYPNPTSETLFVDGLSQEYKQLSIYGINGSQQRIIKLNKDDKVAIDVSTLQSGLYILRAIQETGKVTNIKFTKK